MAIVTGDRYLELLSVFVEQQVGNLLDGTRVLKLNPVGLHYVQTRLEALQELEQLRSGAPVDYMRAYIADLGDHRALEKLRRVLRLLSSLLVVAVLPSPARDPTPITLLPFSKLKSLEFRGCDLSTSAARGLLELRPILEKLVCHNSVNALRHIFAEQTVEINVAQKWSRLAAVACSYNRLYLMDESLQLLPAVDALDLSRNNFAKVANLKECTQLKYLDLGFNHISSVASLNQVLCTVTKLVLRNNSLVSTCGIETLLSLEALDISHNLISNFHEVETLRFLPVLQSLWLNGNPISVSSHYRVEVFSYFHDPRKLEVDGEPMTKLESWFMRGILSRQIEQRVSYGIYEPAKSSDALPVDAGPSDALLPHSRQAHRKKSTRLASIDELGVSKLAAAFNSFHLDVQAADVELETASPGVSEVKEQVDFEIAQVTKQIENMKREGSYTWLNDLVELRECYSRSPGRGDHIGLCENGSRSQRRRADKGVRRLKDAAVLRDLREAAQVLETASKSDFGDIDNLEGDMSLLQLREDRNDVAPVSPPHYDSGLMHRRHNLVNEMLRLPPHLSSSSEGDSDSVDDHRADSVSDIEPSSSSLVAHKAIDFLELAPKSPDNADIIKARIVKNNDEFAGASSSQHSDTRETGKSEMRNRKATNVVEVSPSPVQSPPKTDDLVTGSGESAHQRRQKKTRRIVILD